MDNRHLCRGKRLDNGEWVTGILCPGGTRHMCIAHYNNFSITDDYLWQTVLGNDLFWEVDPATIGQCTGLHAAKSYRGDSEDDRLVFEGDTLAIEGGGGIKTVVFEQGCFQALRYGGLSPLRYFPLKNSETVSAEITGTIHDDPGLLGEGEGGAE